MHSFGKRSYENLDTCDNRIITVCHEVIKYVDFSVIEGSRTDKRQMSLFKQGKTTLDGVSQFSSHQLRGRKKSHAVDVLPYPAYRHDINIWNDEFRFTIFAGMFLGIAYQLGIPMTWGGDWNGDGSNQDQTFHDLPHFELI